MYQIWVKSVWKGRIELNKTEALPGIKHNA